MSERIGPLVTKIRQLTIGGVTYNVDNHRGILDPGKFESEMPHAVRDYDHQDESFGDVVDFGVYAWRCGHRYYYEDSDGFVSETTASKYRAVERKAIEGNWY